MEHVIGDTARLVGTDGGAKMSKSLGNTVYLSDTKDAIREKVMKMYTDPNHLKVEDPGRVEGNAVFSYLDIFDADKDGVAALKAQYEKGGLGDVAIKQRLVEVLDGLIAPIRARREELAKDPAAVMRILEEGTKKARAKGEATMREVRKALKIDYFGN